MTDQEALEALHTIIKDRRIGYGTYYPLEVLEQFNKENLKLVFINELKSLKEKVEIDLGTINGILDWFGENKE